MVTAKQIKVIRKRLGISQEDLSKAMNVSVKTIYRWESGARPSKATMKKFAVFLYPRVYRSLPVSVYGKMCELRVKAIALVQQEKYKGRLPVLSQGKTKCVDCGKTAAHYDHRDYSQPLAVEPVCQSCNFIRGFAVETLQHVWK